MTVGFPASSESLWSLTGYVEGQSGVCSVTINASPFRIGRRPECELRIPHPAISGLHAELVERHGGLVVRDLGSTNGTFRNGQPVSSEFQLAEGDSLQFANVVFLVSRQAVDRGGLTVEEDSSDLAMMLMQFDKLMSERAVVPFFQPIVELDSRRTVGYEVLGRSRLFSLKGPKQMFAAASRLNQEAELSRLLRCEGLQASRRLPEAPNLFLNTHPAELGDKLLVASLEELRECAPDQPITLEIHEAAVTDPWSMHELKARLKELGIGLAYDDFGAGQSRFLELVEVRPDYLKFDIGLIHRMHEAEEDRREFVAHLVHMAVKLGVTPLAEGIECPEELEVCREVGFALGQGFHLGIPQAARCYTGSPRAADPAAKQALPLSDCI